jgi:hypothetical protein
MNRELPIADCRFEMRLRPMLPGFSFVAFHDWGCKVAMDEF